jgi:hypothetical protein
MQRWRLEVNERSAFAEGYIASLGTLKLIRVKVSVSITHDLISIDNM